MQAGNLRKRLVLQQRSSSQDSYGQQVIGWTTLATLWGQVETLSGNQLARAQSIYSAVTHKVTVRYQSLFADIKTVGSYRIVLGSALYDVGASLNIDQRNRTIELLCEEGLNDGQ